MNKKPNVVVLSPRSVEPVLGRAVGIGVEPGDVGATVVGEGANNVQSWVDPDDSAIIVKVTSAKLPVPEKAVALVPVRSNVPSLCWVALTLENVFPGAIEEYFKIVLS